MSAASSGAFGIRLRLAIGLSAIAALGVAGTGWGTLFVANRLIDAGTERERSILERGVRRGLARTAEQISRRLDAVVEVWGRPESPLGGQNRPDLLGAARGLGKLSGLEVLEIVDPDGRIVSSAHWPERIRSAHPEVLDWPHDVPFAVIVDGPSGPRPAWVRCRTVPGSAGSLTMIGGRFLDGALLGELSLGGSAALISADDRLIAAAGPPASDSAYPGRVRVDLELFGPDDEAAGSLAVWGDSSGVAVPPSRLRAWIAIVGAVVTGLAAAVGLWLSRSVTRPVDRMTRAIDAVAEGVADYDFPHPRDDEFAELVASFSRMRRALDRQRERLRAAERVAAWKEAARRVAHEIKNPLVPIRLTMENLVKARRRAPERFDAMFEDGSTAVLEEVERLQGIVSEFGAYARLPEPRTAPEDLDAVIDSVLALYAGDQRVRIVRIRDARLGRVRIDRGQIAQSLKNLLANAVEAMGSAGGEIRVRTDEEDNMAVVEVRDRGPGFDGDAAERVFDPYFTTKATGTGLGLAITYRIVTEHGGTLIAENLEDGGARLVMTLPIGEPTPGKPDGMGA